MTLSAHVIMEELQDAIEDAQYVNAIATQEDGPRPVLAWETPSPEELEAWEKKRLAEHSKAFALETLLENPIGLFLFSTYIKTHHKDYLRINFCEDIIRYKNARGDTKVKMGRRLATRYLHKTEETKPPSQTDIHECDLSRKNPTISADLLEEESFKEAMDYPTCSECFVGLKGKVRTEVYRQWAQQENAERNRKVEAQNSSSVLEAATVEETVAEESAAEGRTEDENLDEKLAESARSDSSNNVRSSEASVQTTESMRSLTQRFKADKSILRDDVFDAAEAIVMESLKKDYWHCFCESEEYKKLKNFLWYGDRRVVPDDFYTMRVLGRGGFGLVTGTCATWLSCALGAGDSFLTQRQSLVELHSMQKRNFWKTLCHETYEQTANQNEEIGTTCLE